MTPRVRPARAAVRAGFTRSAAALALLAVAPGHAFASDWLVAGDLGGALLLTEPQRSRFGPGGTGALAAFRALTPYSLVGLRLRGGLFTNVAGADPSRADPATGGLGALIAGLRVRPLGRRGPIHTGLFFDVGAGGGLTGSLARPMAEAGLGYGFAAGPIAIGPMLRYHHVFQPGQGSDGRDASIALAGLELAWARPPAAAAPPPAPPPKPAPPAPPPGDRDGDGLLDPDDKCPSDPEDADGFEDGDGCPDLDNDRDGIFDAQDACRDLPEVVNGIDDTDGCPDEGLISMVDDRVVLEEKVLFKTDRSRVTSSGRRVLGAVIKLWKQHPEWERLDVEGHCDHRGPDAWNQKLSDDRAARVRQVLIELGIEEGKITARGFGNKRPRTSGRDEESMQKNRRVELVVIRKIPAAGGGGGGTVPPLLREIPAPALPPVAPMAFPGAPPAPPPPEVDE